ncbi:MAG: hypothetical protein P8L85_06725 [Rubripirellula sp.]|nr:hypothetical protein [Rubripirellula sp.]
MTKRAALPSLLFVIAGLLLIGFMLAGGFAAVRHLHEIPVALECDGTRGFVVGDHSVTIETKSLSLQHGDDGAAEVIVAGAAFETVLPSWFNQDLFMDVHPAHYSWQDVDSSPGRDLLIWMPASPAGTLLLVASHYLSSGDGLLHVLNTPLQRQYSR